MKSCMMLKNKVLGFNTEPILIYITYMIEKIKSSEFHISEIYVFLSHTFPIYENKLTRVT